LLNPSQAKQGRRKPNPRDIIQWALTPSPTPFIPCSLLQSCQSWFHPCQIPILSLCEQATRFWDPL
jgi:hypothetical protein